MGHSVCFSPQRPVWTSRSSKCSSFLTALLAFSFGIGVGVLIPLYLLPASSTTFLRSSGVYGDETAAAYEQQFTFTPQSVILDEVDNDDHDGDAEEAVKRRTLYLSDLTSTTTPSYVNMPPRFTRYASTLRPRPVMPVPTAGARRSPDKVPIHPAYSRPTSSVKFIVPDVRVLSLDPVQHDDSAVRINLTEPSGGRSEQRVSSGPEQVNNELLDGIYWSAQVEKRLPPGFTDEEIRSWRRFVKESTVSNIQEGCGRMQNRLLSLENGTRACCRYRHNFDQIQGEIFGFYLSQILKIRNLAPSALNIIQPFDEKWSSVRPQLNVAQWAEDKPVVLTRFIDNLAQAYIPVQFRGSNRRLHPIDLVLSSNSVESADVNELAQWSDLIVFDYLTANLDRMVNNLYNLQWNPSMMEAPAHNLAKDTKTGLLVFLDNESGLLHGYRLLDKYEQYHRVILDSLCVFRKGTADAIKRLHRDRNVGQLLKSMFYTLEPSLTNYLPVIPDKSIKILNHRIERVYDQITKCESLYMSNTEV